MVGKLLILAIHGVCAVAGAAILSEETGAKVWYTAPAIFVLTTAIIWVPYLFEVPWVL